MMITEQERRRRRLKYRFIQLVLIMLTVGIGVAFVAERRGSSRPNIDIDVDLEPNPPAVSELAPGDVQIFNRDSTVDLILSGPVILAGLSPQSVERIREEMARSTSDQTGIGAQIAKTVTEQVADKIGMHVQYDVVDIRDLRLEDDRIVIEWRNGRERELFGQVKTRGRSGETNSFRPEDATRFIEAVKRRMTELRR